jgi:hypothetical protein
LDGSGWGVVVPPLLPLLLAEGRLLLLALLLLRTKRRRVLQPDLGHLGRAPAHHRRLFQVTLGHDGGARARLFQLLCLVGHTGLDLHQQSGRPLFRGLRSLVKGAPNLLLHACEGLRRYGTSCRRERPNLTGPLLHESQREIDLTLLC